jgi:large subunit ribosomal protein L19
MPEKSTDLVRRVTWDRLSKRKNLPQFQTGDTVGVYVKVKEGEKERIQLFTGVVVKLQGNGVNRTFTVRKIASGVGVERTFPFLSPVIDRVEMISRGKVRRARLFYLRGLKGRSARLNTEAYYADGAAPGAADEVADENAGNPEALAAAAEEKAKAAAEKKAAKAARQAKTAAAKGPKK